MNKKTLVTGSSGFIGSHLVKRLNLAGHEVYGLDIKVPEMEYRKMVFYQCDINSQENLLRVISDCRPGVVIHLAARTDLDGKNVAEYSANVDGVRNLAEVIADTPSVKRCIYASSQLVCRVGYLPESDQDYCPSTVYGESKVLMETIVRETNGGNKAWCLVRPTTVWGPGMNLHYQKFFRLIARGQYFHLGRRPLFKSYGYVGNVAYQLQKLAEIPEEQINGKVFYLSDYQPISIRQWVCSIRRELGVRPILSLPLPFARGLAGLGDFLNLMGFRSFPFNTFRLENILTEYVFDLEKTEQVCGSLPFSMEQGVEELVAWIRQDLEV